MQKEKQPTFVIRKLTIGAASVLVGLSFFGSKSQIAHADTVSADQNTQASAVQTQNSQAAEQNDIVQTTKTNHTQINYQDQNGQSVAPAKNIDTTYQGYYKKAQGQVTYHDDTTNHDIGNSQVSGYVGQKPDLTKSYTDKGYDVVNSNQGRLSQNSQDNNYTVHLKHHIDSHVTNTQKATNTINYVDSQNNKLANSQIQSYSFQTRQDTDRVTGKTTTELNETQHVFSGIKNPVIDGYITNSAESHSTVVTPIDLNKQENVIYKKLGKFIMTDTDNNIIGVQTYQNDEQDASQVINLAPDIDGYKLTSEFDKILDPTKNTTLIYQKINQTNPSNPDNPNKPDQPDNPPTNPDQPNTGNSSTANPSNPDSGQPNPDNPNKGDSGVTNPTNPDNPNKGDTDDNQPDNPSTKPDQPNQGNSGVTNPANPDNPGKPDQSGTPSTNPDQPNKGNSGINNPSNPDNPDKPDRPDNPSANPDQPNKPNTPDQNNTDKPSKPDSGKTDPNKPSDSAKPDDSKPQTAKPGDVVKPNDPHNNKTDNTDNGKVKLIINDVDETGHILLDPATNKPYTQEYDQTLKDGQNDANYNVTFNPVIPGYITDNSENDDIVITRKMGQKTINIKYRKLGQYIFKDKNGNTIQEPMTYSNMDDDPTQANELDDTPTIPGYELEENQSVTIEDPTKDTTLIYDKLPDSTITLDFIDETNDQQIGQKVLTGKVYSSSDAVSQMQLIAAGYESQGYVLDDSDLQYDPTFSQKNQTYKTYFKHNTKRSLKEKRYTHRTIHFVDKLTGKPMQKDAVQTAEWKQYQVTDSVTGVTTSENTWQVNTDESKYQHYGDDQYESFKVPFYNGWRTDESVIQSVDLPNTPDDPDANKEITIYYTQNGHFKIHMIKAKQTVVGYTTYTDSNGKTYTVRDPSKDRYEFVEDTGNNLNKENITYTNDRQSYQTIEGDIPVPGEGETDEKGDSTDPQRKTDGKDIKTSHELNGGEVIDDLVPDNKKYVLHAEEYQKHIVPKKYFTGYRIKVVKGPDGTLHEENGDPYTTGWPYRHHSDGNQDRQMDQFYAGQNLDVYYRPYAIEGHKVYKNGDIGKNGEYGKITNFDVKKYNPADYCGYDTWSDDGSEKLDTPLIAKDGSWSDPDAGHDSEIGNEDENVDFTDSDSDVPITPDHSENSDPDKDYNPDDGNLDNNQNDIDTSTPHYGDNSKADPDPWGKDIPDDDTSNIQLGDSNFAYSENTLTRHVQAAMANAENSVDVNAPIMFYKILVNGQEVARDLTEDQLKDYTITVNSPIIKGKTPDQNTIKLAYDDPAENIITVKYSRSDQNQSNPSKDGNTDSSNPSKDGNTDSSNPSKDGNTDSNNPSKDSNTDSSNPSKDGNTDSSNPSKDSNTNSSNPSKDDNTNSNNPSKDSNTDSSNPSKDGNTNSNNPSKDSNTDSSNPSKDSNTNSSNPSKDGNTDSSNPSKDGNTDSNNPSKPDSGKDNPSEPLAPVKPGQPTQGQTKPNKPDTDNRPLGDNESDSGKTNNPANPTNPSKGSNTNPNSPSKPDSNSQTSPIVPSNPNSGNPANPVQSPNQANQANSNNTNSDQNNSQAASGKQNNAKNNKKHHKNYADTKSVKKNKSSKSKSENVRTKKKTNNVHHKATGNTPSNTNIHRIYTGDKTLIHKKFTKANKLDLSQAAGYTNSAEAKQRASRLAQRNAVNNASQGISAGSNSYGNTVNTNNAQTQNALASNSASNNSISRHIHSSAMSAMTMPVAQVKLQHAQNSVQGVNNQNTGTLPQTGRANYNMALPAIGLAVLVNIELFGLAKTRKHN